MTKGGFVPDRGDIVWLSLDPTLGHEQSGRRPALVLSPAEYNGKTGLAVVVPITSKKKGYPFEVAVPTGRGVTGVILSDQVKSLDWRTRKAELADRLPEDTVLDVVAKTLALLDPDGAFGGTEAGED